MVQGTRELNRSAILTELLRSRPSSRKQLAVSTGVSQPTVTRAVDELIADGLLFEGQEIIVESRGRRARTIDLVADRALVLGVDLGASNTRVLLADLLATPIAVAVLSTPPALPPRDLARWLAEELRTVAGPQWRRISQVALGLPGAVSQEDGSVSNAPNLSQVESPEFLATLREALGKPLQIDNDANYALLGELRFGAARESPNAAILTLGAGLGAGLAVEGRLLQGSRGLVGEFGQLPAGPMGSRLEQLVTGPGILRRAREANAHLEDPSALFAEGAPPHVRALRAQFDQALLLVLMAIVVSCEPDTIVLGGGISKSLIPDLGQYEDSLRMALRYSPTLTAAALGDYSGAAGAAVASLHAEYASIGVQRDALASLPGGTTLNVASLRAAGAS
ncbi:MAG TPA: ROK family protein [Marmoricola sp.]